MKVFVALLLFAAPSFAQTIGNDNSCDISVAPAATLLLPYFEADVYQGAERAQDTIVTVTNVSPVTQIAHVTIWTNLAYPLYAFDLILTGYDVQAISMRDLLTSGRIAGGVPRGYFRAPIGSRSFGNPKHNAGVVSGCLELPSTIPPEIVAAVQRALTLGTLGDCDQVGTTHTNAIGYVTIDVVNKCASAFPTEPSYYQEDLLFDNVLIGDYAFIAPNPITGNYAVGSPLVHIRAIPEGSLAGEPLPTPLRRTFYEVYTPASTPHIDRRQPLPAAFAARYIEGGLSGFLTGFVVWRQGIVPPGSPCAEYSRNQQDIREVIRFDERENAFIKTEPGGFTIPPKDPGPPATIRIRTENTSIFPALTSGDVGGWMYLNLTSPTTTQTQGWVVSTMTAEGRFATAFDAAPLGNGCSSPPAVPAVIGPMP
ncbi:MAG TPA: hypothetical protein VMU84_19985 [Thermoanaerobaculia bacterium]|nr:hypothetical protein [Thermoanaerobaculia bacterium]